MSTPTHRPQPIAPVRPVPVTVMAKDVVRGDWVQLVDSRAREPQLVASAFTQGVEGPAARTAITFSPSSDITMPADTFLLWKGHTVLPDLPPPTTLAESTPSNPLWELVVAHHEMLTAVTPPEGVDPVAPLPPEPVAPEEPVAQPELPTTPPRLNETEQLPDAATQDQPQVGSDA